MAMVATHLDNHIGWPSIRRQRIVLLALLFSRENKEWVMQEIYKALWGDLSKRGRAVVLVVGMLAVAGLLATAMFLKYDLSWLPGLLGAE